MPLHSCSLMLNIVGTEPMTAHHHVVRNRDACYTPPSNLTIAYDFLNRHRHVKVYTFSQVVTEDPAARHRRIEQLGDWTEFVHLAFWDGERPDAVLSVRREGEFSAEELTLLQQLHSAFDAAIRRLRILEIERYRRTTFESFVARLPMPMMLLTDDQQLSFATEEGYEACAIWNLGEREARAVNPRRAFELPGEIAAACSVLSCSHNPADLNGRPTEELAQIVRHPTSAMMARISFTQANRGPWARPGFLVTFAFDPDQKEATATTHDRRILKYLQVLSPCERRVALLVSEGCRNREIARRLNRSERTVEFQLNSVYRKLKINHRLQLARALT